MQAPFADPLSGLELLNKALPLVGRETEMQAIRALLDTVAINRPMGARALTISGEMGIGKSRLLAEMYLEARARGFRVLEGRTYETGSMFPYLPFIEALRPVLRSSTPQALRHYLGLSDPIGHQQAIHQHEPEHLGAELTSALALTGTPLVAALAHLFPELPASLHVTITPEVLSPDQEKFRLFDAIATLLENMARERPVLLGIDNLQWADSSSLELTMYLTIRLHSSYVALAGVTRPPAGHTVPQTASSKGTPLHERSDTEERVMAMAATIAAARALGDLVRQGMLLLLPLGPLDAEAADQHLHTLLPDTFSQELAQSLLSRAEGNPFFLEELVRTLTLNQLLVLRNGEWRATQPITTQIPQNITLAVEQRLQGLSTACRRLLRIASLFGRIFALAPLTQVLAEPEDAIQLLIDEASQAAIIAKAPVSNTNWDEYTNDVADTTLITPTALVDPSLIPTLPLVPTRGKEAWGASTTTFPVYMFYQGVVQEVLSAEVPTHQARKLHGAIAIALEASYAGTAPAHAAELARHYALSGDKQGALRWSLLAGEDAARQQAHREAISHFRLVLSLLEAGIPLPQRQPLPSPAQLHILIGESWFKLGELEQALHAFQQALQENVGPRFIAGPPLVGVRADGDAEPQNVVTPLVGVRADGGVRGQMLLARANRLIADVYRMQSKYDLARAHLQAVRTIFDATMRAPAKSNSALGEITGVSISTTERILFLQAQATLDVLLNRTQEAETALWQSHQLATEIADRGSQAFALQLLGWLCGWGERIHEAIRFQEQAHELYVAIGDPFRAALVDQVLGIVYQALGEMEHARLCTLRGFERARRYGARRILGLLHWNHGAMALAQGDWASSASHLQQAWQEAEANDNARLKPMILQAQAELHFRQGNWHQAEQLFLASIQAAATTEWYPGAVALYGHYLAVTGRRTAAQAQLDRAAAHVEPPGLAGSFYIPFLAEGYIHLGAHQQAATYIERIRSMRGSMHYGNSVDRILGVVATLASDWKTAEQAFEDGLALCRRANNEPEEAAILYEQARAALMVGAVGARFIAPAASQSFAPEAHSNSLASPIGWGGTNIHDLCDRARELFLRYNMQRAADLVNTLQEGIRQLEQHRPIVKAEPIPTDIQSSHKVVGARFIAPARDRADATSATSFSLTLHLTGRELDVLRLVAEGHTDREVADTLVISPRTVNRHLSNIFIKLDVPGRAAAVAYAIRQSIV